MNIMVLFNTFYYIIYSTYKYRDIYVSILLYFTTLSYYFRENNQALNSKTLYKTRIL